MIGSKYNMKKKLILVGHYAYDFYEPAFEAAIKKNNIEVVRFMTKPRNRLLYFFWKFEEYFTYMGPVSIWYFFQLKKLVKKVSPHIIFFWRPTIISPWYIQSLKNISTKPEIISYINDNPFGKQYANRSLYLRRLWNMFITSIPYFDVNLIFRPANFFDYDKFGSKRTILFPPAYIPSYIPSSNHSNFLYDIVFIGHAEKKRLDYINHLLESGIRVKLFGTGWDLSTLHSSYEFSEIHPVYQNDYYQSLFAARINLAFLSVLNEDVYTRRNFEIPGMGGLMLSERTFELEKYFSEGKEAFFFSNKEELLEKVQLILADENLQQRVRFNAKNKSIEAGYDLDSRVYKLLADMNL
jgi:spore maturation protein CgeB